MTIIAKIERIIYRNEENYFTVLSTICNNDMLFVTGYFPEFIIGEEIQFTGEYTKTKYGYQFNADDFEIPKINETNKIVDFLSSGFIKGVGLSTAKQIVESFGENTLDILSNAPYRLTEVKGIGETRAAMIISSFNEITGIRKILFQLQKFGFTPKESIKISNYYGKDTIKYITQNPYSLIEDIDGIGFITADKIAIKIGFSKDSTYRIKSAIKYYLNDLANRFGHTCYPKDDLSKEIKKLLGVDEILINEAIDSMLLNTSLKVLEHENDELISLPYFYNKEKQIAVNVLKLLSINTDKYSTSYYHDENIFDNLDDKQIEAINMTLNNQISIITGGPGTGKTTIIKHILSILHDKKFALCAPTGRAAKRISESTGVEAFTIHKLLEYGYGDGIFNKNEDNKLECELIIVDEMSMVDTILFSSLLNAIPSGCKLILIGDIDQLPSVGPGNLLKDLINSNLIPYIQLEKVYRQKDKSLIVENAQLIKNGNMPIIDNSSDDFFFIENNNPLNTQKIIIELFNKRLPNFLNIDLKNIQSIGNHIQILSPTKKGECGTAEINRIIQNIYKINAQNNEYVYSGKSYYVGDKVIQIKNDYELEYEYEYSNIKDKGVFNGEIGTIIDIVDSDIIIKFEDGKIVKYTSIDIENISLAYCLTVHKSQGSEFPVVIIPLVNSSRLLLTRNLLYTAITRSKQIVVLVGSKQVLEYMIHNNYIAKRHTLLQKLIKIFS